MSNQVKMFQYAIYWTPTPKQEKEESLKPKFIVKLSETLAKDADSVKLKAAMEIPQEYKEQLEQITVVVDLF